MKILRECKICETPFVAIKTTQYFCKRKCFKRDYYLRNKEKINAEHANPTFPTKTCAYCFTMQMVPYDPVKQPEKFNKWECVMCGVTNEMLWKHQESPRSYQIITAMLATIPVHPYILTPRQTITIRASFITIMGGETVQVSQLSSQNRRQFIGTLI
jgi:hypothetical protein